jgi:Protein of unknown function DUF262
MDQIEFKEDENQIESDDDIATPDQKSFSSAVLSGNDWTTETIISQINKGNIQLNPNFQRRDAWEKVRKSKFIESLVLGLPVPQVVLAESKDRRGAYIVLDGKQRLLSIRQFAADANDPEYTQLKLSNLEIRKDLNGFTLESLRASIDNFDDVSAFENQPIRTVVIKNWPNENFLYHIFLRLNTGSVPLSPQELRQALHPGSFVSFLDKESSESVCLREILKITKPDFRMRDAELMLRYISYKNFLPSYTGSLKDFLDSSCKNLNATWANDEAKVRSQVAALEQAHISIKSIFGPNSYRKWTGAEYENRFNRSIFDIMSLALSDANVRDLVKGKEILVEDAFKNLCANDNDFRSSIEATTKSVWATHKRLSSWNEVINKTLGANLHIPSLVENRII